MFKTFRKNKKLWVAGLTIAAMFAFIFIGPWSRLGEHSGADRNPEVFTWKFGTVRMSDLQYRVRMRHLVDQFLIRAGLAAGHPEEQVSQTVISIFPPTEQAVMTSMLLARKSDQMGLIVGDDAVNRFIRGWTADRVSRDQLAALIHSLRPDRGTRVTSAELFDAMRFELSALYARQLFAPMFSRSETPADQWDAYCRLNRKVTAQFMAVPVEKFVAQVADPSEDTLRAFYDQYRNTLPNPQSPTPGFREPFKAQFQYFKANYEQFAAAQSPKVTDDEIQAYYDKYKDVFFQKTELPAMPGESTSTESGAPPTQPQTEAQPKSGSDKSGKAEDKSDGKDQEKADSSKSTAPPADGKKSGQSKSAPEGKKSSDSRRSDSLDGELLAQADTKSVDAKSSAAATETKAPPAGDQTKAPPAGDGTAAAEPSGETPSMPPVEYEPLDKVKEIIRSRLVAEKFDQQLDESFLAIRTVMDDYRTDMARYRADVAGGVTSTQQPQRPDLAALATRYNLELLETALVSEREATEALDIAKSYRMAPGSYNATLFSQVAFRPATPLFTPDQTEDSENNRYLWWKVAEQKSRTPPLDEIKEQVLHAWKMVQARTLAETKAKEYAEQANQTKLPLDKAFADLPDAKIIAAGPFTWLTRQVTDPAAPPMVSQVPGLEVTGNAFMRAVFALHVGQAGVAANPQLTTYYVAQLQSEEPSLAELQQGYMASMTSDATSYIYHVIASRDRALGFAQWLNDLKEEFDLRMSSEAPLSERGEDAEI